MKASSGFTLIELLIVVAIVGLLSMVALPSYTEYITRGKLVDGVAELSAARVRMEQGFQDNRSYACPATNPYTKGDFSISCVAPIVAPATVPLTFTITATGTGGVTGFVYTIDQTASKVTTSVATGWGTPSGNCWSVKKGGQC